MLGFSVTFPSNQLKKECPQAYTPKWLSFCSTAPPKKGWWTKKYNIKSKPPKGGHFESTLNGTRCTTAGSLAFPFRPHPTRRKHNKNKRQPKLASKGRAFAFYIGGDVVVWGKAITFSQPRRVVGPPAAKTCGPPWGGVPSASAATGPAGRASPWQGRCTGAP